MMVLLRQMDVTMPEGPEIRRAADKIESVLKNKTIEKVEFGLTPLKKYAKPLTGSKCSRWRPVARLC